MSRTVAFPPSGTRHTATPSAVAHAWRARTAKIPAQYAVATAQHESDFTVNEVDTEPSGFVSKGIFQLSDEELHEAGLANPGGDLLTLEGAVDVLATIAGRRLDRILAAAKLDAPTPDVWFYLALAHNEGMGACLKTIAAHGLDAAAWTERNKGRESLAQAAKYFNDCITGGAKWSTVTDT